MTTETEAKTSSTLSVGAGLAIAGIWLAGAGTTCIILLILFVWSNQTILAAPKAGDWFGYLIFIAVVGAPLIAAYSITKKIIDKDD
ncbi:MAG: hypothetical protein JWN12_605 [Candidatus Saccharibacteria bacterium]|jgi:hypothetical protein|nr:hypothetical protein [Candidatus Saccharibacteria bacterium]